MSRTEDGFSDDDGPAELPPECNGVCLFGADIGVMEAASSLYAADPECELHGDPERHRT